MGRGLGSSEAGRDEPIGVVILMCVEAMLGISLYSYLYLKLAKHHTFLIIFYIFFLLQNWRTREWSRFCLEAGWRGEVAQTMYTHISKCKTIR
jgi:hypothetical protein